MTSTEEVAELLLRLSSSSSPSSSTAEQPPLQQQLQDGDERPLAIRPQTQVGPTSRCDEEGEPSGSKLSLQFILNGSDQPGSLSQRDYDEPEQAIATTRSSSLGNCYTVASAEDGPVEGIADFHAEGTASASSYAITAREDKRKKRRRRGKHSDTHNPEGKRAKLHGHRGSSRKTREASETQPRNGFPESVLPSSSSSLSFSAPSSSLFSSWGRPSAESSAAPSYAWLHGPQGQSGGALDHLRQLQSPHAPLPPLSHSFGGFPLTGHHSGHLPSASSSLPPFFGAHQYAPAPSHAPTPTHTMSEDLLKAEEILRRRLLHIHQQRELLLQQLHHGQASGRYGHPPEPSLASEPTKNKRPSSSSDQMERRTRKRSVAHDDRRPITVALGK